MYLQIPNYLGFNGIAILPHVDAPDATCYVLGDKSEMFLLENSSTYVPYFPGHYYFLYKNMRMNERTVGDHVLNKHYVGHIQRKCLQCHLALGVSNKLLYSRNKLHQ